MTGYTTDPIPAYVRQRRSPVSAPVDPKVAHAAALRRRRLQAAKGENFRALMRAPESARA